MRIGTARLAGAAATVEEGDVTGEESVKGRKTDADYADVDFDYGPEARVNVIFRNLLVTM